MDTLLTGKPYVRSELTDLRKSFARIRRKLKEEAEAKAANEAEARVKVKQIKKAG